MQDVDTVEGLLLVLQNRPSDEVSIAVEGLGLETHAKFFVLFDDLIKVVLSNRLAIQVSLCTVEELRPPSEHYGNISYDIPVLHPSSEAWLIVHSVSDGKLEIIIIMDPYLSF